MAERTYFYADSKAEEPHVREIIFEDEEVIWFLASVNQSWSIFFTSSEPIETVREPFIINKIA